MWYKYWMIEREKSTRMEGNVTNIALRKKTQTRSNTQTLSYLNAGSIHYLCFNSNLLKCLLIPISWEELVKYLWMLNSFCKQNNRISNIAIFSLHLIWIYLYEMIHVYSIFSCFIHLNFYLCLTTKSQNITFGVSLNVK